MPGLIADRLRRRARTAGAAPMLTYYELDSGARIELSATSLLNWVDKISNLLVDDYLLAEGAVIQLDLARTAPGHWITLAVELAAWQVGAVVRVSPAPEPPADLLVLGPRWQADDLEHASEVLACSLHPLGLGFSTPLPPGVADFTDEVRGQPDVHSPTPRTGAEPAWVDDVRSLSQADLVALEPATGSRWLVQPTEAWTTARQALVVPLLTGGSAVVVVGGTPEDLLRIRTEERVDG